MSKFLDSFQRYTLQVRVCPASHQTFSASITMLIMHGPMKFQHNFHGLRSNMWYSFDGSSLGRLGDSKMKGTKAKHVMHLLIETPKNILG